MKTELNIDKAQLKILIEEKYGLCVEDLVFETQGEVSWSYLVKCFGGEKRFFKIHKSKNLKVQRLQLLFNLRTRCQVQNITYPIKTVDESLEIEVVGYPAVLFNFIEGKTSNDQTLSDEELESLGELLAKVHQSKEMIGDYEFRESFGNPFKSGIEKIYANLDAADEASEESEETKKIYRQYKMIFLEEVRLLEQVANKLRSRQIEFVNCHGEPSPQNIIVSPSGQLYLIDWDEPVFAPKERDLMFFADRWGQVMKGYGRVRGDTKLDQDILNYYRRLWNTQEIKDWGTRIFFEKHPPADNQYYLSQLKDFLDYSGLAIK